jgi:hypothetical protein
MSKSPPPSLLGLLAASNATKQSPDDDTGDADETQPNREVGRALLDAFTGEDPEALNDAVCSLVDIHMAGGDASKPTADDKPSKPALVIHVHAHGA